MQATADMIFVAVSYEAEKDRSKPEAPDSSSLRHRIRLEKSLIPSFSCGQSMIYPAEPEVCTLGVRIQNSGSAAFAFAEIAELRGHTGRRGCGNHVVRDRGSATRLCSLAKAVSRQ